MSTLEWKRKPRACIQTFEAMASDGGTYRIEWCGSYGRYDVSYRPMLESKWYPPFGSARTVPEAVALAEDYDRRATAYLEAREAQP